MDGYPEDYGQGPDHSSAEYLAALDGVHRAQEARTTLIRMGDAYLGLARCYARLDPRRVPHACGLCIRACQCYQQAGLSRAGQVAWRWARMLHRRRWREALE